MTDDQRSRTRRRWRSGWPHNADGILEQIAREYGVSTFEVVRSAAAGAPRHRARREVRRRSCRRSPHGARCCSSCTRPTSCWSAPARSRPARSGAATTICTATARSADTSRPRTASTSSSSVAPVHGSAVALAAVLQWRRRGHVQGLRAPRRAARAHCRAGGQIRRIAHAVQPSVADVLRSVAEPSGQRARACGSRALTCHRCDRRSRAPLCAA